MDKITKFLHRLTSKERDLVTVVVSDIVDGNTANYDRKKLKGYANLYRIRIGDIRIIYLDTDEGGRVLEVDRRDDNTYRQF